MNQKRENILNLALETPEEERIRTQNLNVGYQPATKSWEVIVKYHGDLIQAAALLSTKIEVELLIASYAILKIPETLMDAVTDLEEIEYMEKPKAFFYEMDFPAYVGGSDVRVSACFDGIDGIDGEGVLLLVADSGIDWKRREFRNPDGTTRIRFLWDQTLGAEFSSENINIALETEDPAEQFSLLPSVDVSGHGTAVAGIAAGNNGQTGYKGAAPKAELLIVKLGRPPQPVREENAGAGTGEDRERTTDFPAGGPRTTEIMRAVTWGIGKAMELQMPLVINLSFGNSYGSHDGSSLLERFLDNAAEIGRTVVCVGCGNEGASRGHAEGKIRRVTGISGQETGRAIQQSDVFENTRQEFSVAPYEQNLRLQIWQNDSDIFRIFLQSPGGRRGELTAPVNGGKFTLFLEQTKILAYSGEPSPYAVAREWYLEFLPNGSNEINSGIWAIEFRPVKLVTGKYYLYLSDDATRNRGTFFYTPSPQVTLTIPSTAARVISVGAYDSVYQAYADFSGRGYGEGERTIGIVTSGLVKPDLAAPGVNIAAPDLYGGYQLVTGTSFATPIVSGAAALLMEWGIVRKNDVFLYGEKLKAKLRAGAGPLRGEQEYPNERVGYGALCVSASIQI